MLHRREFLTWPGHQQTTVGKKPNTSILWSEDFHPCPWSISAFPLPAFSTDYTKCCSAIAHSKWKPDKVLKKQRFNPTLFCSHGWAGPTVLPILFHGSRFLKLGVGTPPPLWEKARAAGTAKICSSSFYITLLLLKAPRCWRLARKSSCLLRFRV